MGLVIRVMDGAVKEESRQAGRKLCLWDFQVLLSVYARIYQYASLLSSRVSCSFARRRDYF